MLGMHRSGTSAVTRLINLMGLAAPRPDDLVPASAKNPTGYWESMSLVAFNTRVLGAMGSDMRCPLRLEPGWEEDSRLDDLRTQAVAAVHRTFPSTPWVWKDPRNCLAYAFWRETLDVRHVAVVVHRNPLEIAASTIRQRSDESKIYLLALWERYLRQALEQVAGMPVRVADYQSVLADPVIWCQATSTFLGASRPRDEDVLAFVDPGLRHTAYSADDFLNDPDVSDPQRALFTTLNELAGDHDEFRVPALPRETPTTEALLAERRRALELIDGMRQELAAARWSRLKPLFRLGLAPTE